MWFCNHANKKSLKMNSFADLILCFMNSAYFLLILCVLANYIVQKLQVLALNLTYFGLLQPELVTIVSIQYSNKKVSQFKMWW